MLERERQIAPLTRKFPWSVLFLNIALDQSAQEKSLSYCEKKKIKKRLLLQVTSDGNS